MRHRRAAGLSPECVLPQPSYEDDAKVVVTLAALEHPDYIERGGSESVEVILWRAMRGALSERVRRVHRNYYHATLTGYAQPIFEDLA